jgi:hypothetical protein
MTTTAEPVIEGPQPFTSEGIVRACQLKLKVAEIKFISFTGNSYGKL